MLYEGSDGNVHILGDGEELKHYKYIKKIKQGSGWRYFYTPEELKAFYEGSKAAYKVGNNVLDKKDDYKTNKKIKSLESAKSKKQEKQAWDAYIRVGARGGTEKEAYKEALKAVAKTEAKYQVDKAKLQAKNELGKKKRAAKSEVTAATDTARLAAKGAKDAADSVPRLKKQSDNRYYIADKKTQKKIAKNLSKARKDYNKINDIHRSPRKPGDAIGTANRAAKLTARVGAGDAYRKKYEAKNVTAKKMSEIKNKASKGRAAVEKKLKKNKKK